MLGNVIFRRVEVYQKTIGRYPNTRISAILIDLIDHSAGLTKGQFLPSCFFVLNKSLKTFLSNRSMPCYTLLQLLQGHALDWKDWQNHARH